MAEYTTALTVDTDAATLFAWVADLANLPAYVRQVRTVTVTGLDTVTITLRDGGTCPGWVRVYRDARQMAWGTDSGAYRGELHVTERLGPRGTRVHDDAPPGGPRCSLTVTVRADRLAAGPLSGAVEAALEALVDSALGVCRRTDRRDRVGGGIAPRAARPDPLSPTG